MPLTRSKRYVATRDRWKSYSSGCTTGPSFHLSAFLFFFHPSTRPAHVRGIAQVVELESRVQEAGQEWYEHLSRRTHLWPPGYRKDNECALVCQVGGVYADRAQCERCTEQKTRRGRQVGRAELLALTLFGL